MISAEHIKDLQQRVDTLGRCISIDDKRAEVAAKTERTLAADFWDDPKEAEKFLKELSGVKFWVTGYDKVVTSVEDLNVLLEFEDEETDSAYEAAVAEVEALELRNMLGEEGDNLGAVLTYCKRESLYIAGKLAYICADRVNIMRELCIDKVHA